MKRILVVLTAVTLLGGCATVNGIGQDISAGADKVSGGF